MYVYIYIYMYMSMYCYSHCKPVALDGLPVAYPRLYGEGTMS